MWLSPSIPPDEKDARAVVVVPSIAGVQVIDELSSPFGDLCASMTANISNEDLEILQRCLQLMLRNLQDATS